MLSSLARVLSFGRSGAPFVSSELMSTDIAQYYQRIVIDCLRRMLVPPSAVDVVIRAAAPDASGKREYSAYIRLLRWDSGLAPVLLQNLPVLDGRIRSMAQASVLLEHTRFGGVWMQAASTVPGAPSALAGLPAELIRQSSARSPR